MKINPEFLRNVRIQLPQRRAIFLLGTTISLILIGLILLWFSLDFLYSSYYWQHHERVQQFGIVSFVILTAAQFILLHVIGTGAAAMSVVQERLRGTLIFQQMTLLSPRSMAIGKLFGSTATCYLIAAVIFPFSFFTGLIANFSAIEMLNTYALLFIGGICWQALGLFLSALTVNGSGSSAWRNLLGISVSGLAGVTAFAYPDMITRYNSGFLFGIKMPIVIILLLLMMFVGGWAFAGAVRSFKSLQLIPLSPKMIWYFFASLETLLVGLCWRGYFLSSYISYRNAVELVIFFLAINWVALTILSNSLAISRDRLREWWSAERDANAVTQRAEIRNNRLTYRMAVGLSLVGFAAFSWSLSTRELTEFEYEYYSTTHPIHFGYGSLLVVALSFLITMAAMSGFMQYLALHRFRFNQVAMIFWILFFVITGITGAIMGKESFAMLVNPLAFADSVLYYHSINAVIKGLSAGIVLATVCLGLSAWKWRKTYQELVNQPSR
ncbi:MAG: hypothetical protein AB1489_12245 [Acidobacteriota bacterium]